MYHFKRSCYVNRNYVVAATMPSAAYKKGKRYEKKTKEILIRFSVKRPYQYEYDYTSVDTQLLLKPKTSYRQTASQLKFSFAFFLARFST